MRAAGRMLLSAITIVTVVGCASMDATTKQRQVASMLGYLYPGSDKAAPPPTTEQVVELRVPFRIGIAFVPDNTDPRFRLPESERQRLAGEARDAFVNYPFVRGIETVPSMYLEREGGFDNLDRIASLLRLEVIALVSYDQVQNSGANGWSFLYWTGVGAYAINGDQYDILTAVDTAVFDVKSRHLLIRAGGLSKTRGSASVRHAAV
jgi:rhombotail lipoprotein